MYEAGDLRGISRRRCMGNRNWGITNGWRAQAVVRVKARTVHVFQALAVSVLIYDVMISQLGHFDGAEVTIRHDESLPASTCSPVGMCISTSG